MGPDLLCRNEDLGFWGAGIGEEREGKGERKSRTSPVCPQPLPGAVSWWDLNIPLLPLEKSSQKLIKDSIFVHLTGKKRGKGFFWHVNESHFWHRLLPFHPWEESGSPQKVLWGRSFGILAPPEVSGTFSGILVVVSVPEGLPRPFLQHHPPKSSFLPSLMLLGIPFFFPMDLGSRDWDWKGPQSVTPATG